MKYIIVEGFRRFIQILFGMEIFDFPGLQSIRGLAYRIIYKIGSSPVIEHGVRLSKSHHQDEGKITIGKHVTLARNAQIDYTGEVIIGDDVIFSAGAMLFSHSHNVTVGWTKKGNKQVTREKIEIKDGAWIGANAMILPSVHYIGENAVIGACSVVTKDVPDNAVVVGNPAKFLKEVE